MKVEWPKKNIKDGGFISFDGCEYANEHQAVHYGIMKLCGCGSPEEAYNFCLEILKCFDRRGDGEWTYAEDFVERLILKSPKTAAHLFSHLLTNLRLLEHGGSVGGSWPTEIGHKIIDLGPMTEESLEQIFFVEEGD